MASSASTADESVAVCIAVSALPPPEVNARRRARDAALQDLLREEEDTAMELSAVDWLDRPHNKRLRVGQGDAHQGHRKCPHVASVQRTALDFDFEKSCSISLATTNVYACLVCGRYFQGRGQGTHAHTHALEESHHVFMHLGTGRVYCLPDGYEVLDATLGDIAFNRDPLFSPNEIDALDRPHTAWTRGLDGTEFLPGTVGLNNIRKHDYLNVVVQLVNRVTPVRNLLMRTVLSKPLAREQSPLAWRLGELLRKLWNPRAFKGHVSPHEFLQAVITQSKKRFGLDTADPVEFLQWLLNALHRELRGHDGSSIIHRCFRGELEVETLGPGDTVQGSRNVHFLMLGLDLPAQPLFKDELERNIIPQVPLAQLLRKYDGVQVTDTPRQGRRRFRLRRLPEYLVLHAKRFSRNNFFLEKNHTLVTFPIRGLDVAEAVAPAALPIVAPSTRYKLVANVVHEGKPGAGNAHHVHVQRCSEGPGSWYEIRDLRVQEILPQLVGLSEAYVQVYERDT